MKTSQYDGFRKLLRTITLTCFSLLFTLKLNSQTTQQGDNCQDAIPIALCTEMNVIMNDSFGNWTYEGSYQYMQQVYENYHYSYRLVSVPFTTNGKEHFFSFTPLVTGSYYFNAYPTGYGDIYSPDQGPHYKFFFEKTTNGCNEITWNEIGDFGNGIADEKKIINLLAGVEYYFMMDGEAAKPGETYTVTFQLCKMNEPDCSLATAIETCTEIHAAIPAEIGAWDFGSGFSVLGYKGPSTPGKELIYKFTPALSGVYALIVKSNGGPVSYLYKPANGECKNEGWKEISTNTLPGIKVIDEPLTSGSAYYLLLDNQIKEGSFAIGQTFELCPYEPAVCIPFQQLTLCNPVSVSIEKGLGSWDFAGTDPNNSLGIASLGKEKFARFTPAVAANYYLEVTSASGGYINYLFKEASNNCSDSGWRGINRFNAPGGNNLGFLKAGVEYEFVLANENETVESTQSFKICMSPEPTCSPAIYAGLTDTIKATIPKGVGTWDNYPTTEWNPPNLSGKEVFFRFTAPTTSKFSINQYTGTPVKFYFKAEHDSCSSNNFKLFAKPQPLQQGTSYLVMADQPGIDSNAIAFKIIEEGAIVCPGNSLLLRADFDKYYNEYPLWEINWYKNDQPIDYHWEYYPVDHIPSSASGDTYYAVMVARDYHYEWYYFKSEVFTIAIRSVWTGTISTAWEEPGNWSCNVVPDEYTEVFIPKTTHQPVVTSNQEIKKLFILEGASLTVKPPVELTIKSK